MVFLGPRSSKIDVVAAEELHLLDEEIATLRQQLLDLRDDLRDFDDSSAATRMQEELEAQIAELESRRDALLAGDANGRAV
ncbi:MAG: hypothetical protein QOF97_3425 [Acidimicrobiaceae bacterium]